MGDHLAISRGPFTGPLNPLKTDVCVSRGPPGLLGGPGPLGPTVIQPLPTKPSNNLNTGFGLFIRLRKTIFRHVWQTFFAGW